MFSITELAHRLFNKTKNNGRIEDEIAQRRSEGEPTRFLEEELASRRGGDDSYNQTAINPGLPTSEIVSRIADREARGLPTTHLRQELSGRPDGY